VSNEYAIIIIERGFKSHQRYLPSTMRTQYKGGNDYFLGIHKMFDIEVSIYLGMEE
jgi:hypothetical protein